MKELPDKLYYSISEVASFAGVKAHVLRYWESEFPSLKPKKNRDRGAHVEQLELIQPAAAQARAGKPASRKQKVAALKKDLSELIDFVRDF